MEPTLRDINLKIYPGEKVLIIGPVSYTHLDVYKRQMHGIRTKKNESTTSKGRMIIYLFLL